MNVSCGIPLLAIFVRAMENRKHYAAGILAFVIWGFFAIPLRALKEFSSGEILYFRILFSLIVLGVVIIGFRRKELRADWTAFRTSSPLRKRAILWLTLAGGALLTINWLTFIYIVTSVNVKTASFAYLICPVITAVLGYLLLHEKLAPRQWLAVGVCAISCCLVGLSSWIELGFSFFTAFTYALYLISQRKNQGFDRIVVLGIQILFSFVILTMAFNFLVDTVPQTGFFYSTIFIIAVVFTVFPLFLNLFALNRINSATIGILMYLNPLFNFTVAFVVYNEKVAPLQVTGYGLIAVALVLFNLHHFKRLQAITSAQKA